MKGTRLVVVLIALSTLLVACQSSPSTTPSTSVPWKDYAVSLKERIDKAAATKDCTALQREFNSAETGNAATKTRTGHNNSALMGYIDQSMREAACYK